MSIEGWSLLFQAIQAVAIVVAAIQLILFVLDRKKASQDVAIATWRIALFHRVFSKNPYQVFSIDSLLEKYRVEASAFAGAPLSQHELTEDRLRELLIEMSRRRVCKNLGNDQYQCEFDLPGTRDEQMDRSMGALIQSVMQPFEAAIGLEGAIFALVSKNVNGTPRGEMEYEVSEIANVDRERARAEIAKHLALGKLDERDGLIFLGRQIPEMLKNIMGPR